MSIFDGLKINDFIGKIRSCEIVPHSLTRAAELRSLGAVSPYCETERTIQVQKPTDVCKHGYHKYPGVEDMNDNKLEEFINSKDSQATKIQLLTFSRDFCALPTKHCN